MQSRSENFTIMTNHTGQRKHKLYLTHISEKGIASTRAYHVEDITRVNITPDITGQSEHIQNYDLMRTIVINNALHVITTNQGTLQTTGSNYWSE